MKVQKIGGSLFAAVFAFSMFAGSVCSAQTETNKDSANNSSSLYAGQRTEYSAYMAEYSNAAPITASVTIDLKGFKGSGQDFAFKKLDNGDEVLSTLQEGQVDFAVTVPKTGLYRVNMTYYPLPGSGSTAVRSFLIDGNIPYYEASVIEFPRIWADAESDVKFDNIGNELLPMQKETPKADTVYFRNNAGLSNDILYFYLTEGTHIVSLKSVREPLAIMEMKLESKSELPAYAQIQDTYEKNGYQSVAKPFTLQGEDVVFKSDATMYPLNDKTSPLTDPASDYYVRYNTIGGSKWQKAGQWLEWEITVPENGLYTISMRCKQNLKNNSTVYRRLYIDGKIPFAEADQIAFGYMPAYKGVTLGDKENGDYRFYLEAGKTHTIRLEVVTGVFAPILEETQEIVNQLNEIYREILMITGPNPDLYRDYDFPAMIPETLNKMVRLSKQLDKLQEKIKNLTGWKNGSELSAIQRITRTLNEMVSDDSTIAARFSNFQDNISGLASWVLDAKNQPLEIDYFVIGGDKKDIAENGGFFSIFSHQVKQFFGSFVIDYNLLGQVGDVDDDAVTVWIQTGRDQSQIIRGLINQDFTPNHGIGVNLQLVAAGNLLPAIIAGLGPDVALQLGQGEPMNYAYRNAVYDLANFKDYKDVVGRFSSQAMVPFTFRESVYALPESQSFQMLFYRKDILGSLGITKENLSTWEGIYKVVIPEMQKNYLSFGFTPSILNYAMLLNQAGGQIYSDDGSECYLNSSEAVNIFKSFIRLYTEYTQPVAFDFANRFRTGQMPLAVMDFTAYNQLSVFAPEIAGLWEMSPLPATLRADGTKDNSAVLSVTGCVLFEYSQNKKNAWEFMKWWTDAGVQTQYGKNMESIMGTAARYNSANLEAFESVTWDKEIRTAISEQMQSVEAIPEVPGGYYTSRYFDFAYKDVISNAADIRSTLNKAVMEINAEILNKREEFGIK